MLFYKFYISYKKIFQKLNIKIKKYNLKKKFITFII